MNAITRQRIKDLQKLLALNRIRLLELLYEEDICVCKLVEILHLKHNLISHHLKTLLDIGYLESTRNGQHIIYKLVESKKAIVRELLDLIHK